MAKQTGAYKITGTYEDVTYYKMDGQYYARKKSSLKGERVKKDPRFQRTMKCAERLGRATQLASKVYRSLPRQEQVYALFCTLKSAAMRALKEGKEVEEVKALLKDLVSTGSEKSEVKSETRLRHCLRITTAVKEGFGGRGKEVVRYTQYAVRKGCRKAKGVLYAGGQLFVDGAGRLVAVRSCKRRTAEGVTGPKRARAQSP